MRRFTWGMMTLPICGVVIGSMLGPLFYDQLNTTPSQQESTPAPVISYELPPPSMANFPLPTLDEWALMLQKLADAGALREENDYFSATLVHTKTAGDVSLNEVHYLLGDSIWRQDYNFLQEFPTHQISSADEPYLVECKNSQRFSVCAGKMTIFVNFVYADIYKVSSQQPVIVPSTVPVVDINIDRDSGRWDKVRYVIAYHFSTYSLE